MSNPFAFDLRVVDVDGRIIVDPTIFVRVTNEIRTVTAQVAFDAAAVSLRFDERPAGQVLQLRLTPSRYHDCRIFCQVDGNGTISPPEIRIPRRSSEWLAAFDKWNTLAGPLKKLVGTFGRKLERKTVHPPHYKPGVMLCSLEPGAPSVGGVARRGVNAVRLFI